MSPSGAITVGSLIQYQLYWNMINSAYQALNNVLNSFTRAAGAAERVLSLVDMEPDIGSGSGMGAIDPGGAPVDVAVRRGTSRSRTSTSATRCARPTSSSTASASPSTRARCALVGKSGGGKSTLVHLLLRFYDPQAGRISLGGVDYRDLNLASLHKQIGVVSQETQLFNATIERTSRTVRRRTPTPSSPRHACRVRLRVHRLVRGRPPHARRRARPAARRRRSGSRSRAACCASRSCCSSTRRRPRSTPSRSSGQSA